MQSRLTHRIAVVVAVTGVAATGLAWALGGTDLAAGAVAGAIVALSNWTALRWLLGRLTRPGATRSARAAGILLTLKMGAVFVVCWWLIVGLGLDAVGLALGLTALPVGLVLGALGTGVAPSGDGRDPRLGEKLEG